MKNPEIVLQELGDLYEFYRQIKTFKIKDKNKSNKTVQLTSSTRAARTRSS